MALNFDCVFSHCDFRQNDIDEKDFLEHLDERHLDEMRQISEKEGIPVEMAKMIAASNSSVFISRG